LPFLPREGLSVAPISEVRCAAHLLEELSEGGIAFRFAILRDPGHQERKEVSFDVRDPNVRVAIQESSQQLRAGARHADDEQRSNVRVCCGTMGL
jgi:hypothetical protein